MEEEYTGPKTRRAGAARPSAAATAAPRTKESLLVSGVWQCHYGMPMQLQHCHNTEASASRGGGHHGLALQHSVPSLNLQGNAIP